MKKVHDEVAKYIERLILRRLKPGDKLPSARESCKGGRAMNVEALDGFFAAGQPTTRFVLRRRFLGGQFHGHQPAVRGSAFPLPPPLLQMPIQRAEAQTPTAAKLEHRHVSANRCVGRTLTVE